MQGESLGVELGAQAGFEEILQGFGLVFDIVRADVFVDEGVIDGVAHPLVNEFVIQVDGLVFDDGAADGIGIMDADAVCAGKRLVQRTL